MSGRALGETRFDVNRESGTWGVPNENMYFLRWLNQLIRLSFHLLPLRAQRLCVTRLANPRGGRPLYEGRPILGEVLVGHSINRQGISERKLDEKK